jgi:monoterpene epsilon-lactone hydrolase
MASEQLEATIAMMREIALFTGDLEADRAAMGGIGTGVPEGIPHEMVRIAGCNAAWMTAPAGAVDSAILYLHGGGYVMGSLGTHGAFAARLATEAAVAVLLLDYRLGPEHCHPAALDDAMAATEWLRTEKGIEARNLIIAGDSAGGGLTLAALAALRDAGVTVAGGVVLSPWADLTCRNPSHEMLAAADPLVSPHALRTYATAYAGATALDDPRLSPGLGNLAGLPPVLVQVGGVEVLLDDSRAVAASIQAAGGEVTLQTWDEAIHVFQILGTPESDEAIAEIARFVKDRLG